MKQPHHKIDFAQVAAHCLAHAESLLRQWFPAGRINGREFEIGSLAGEEGASLRININTGLWKDFAADLSGGDLISLYAAMKGIKQLDAAKALSSGVTGGITTDATPPAPRPKQEHSIAQPPNKLPMPSCHHFEFGKPTRIWTYLDANGDVINYVARYDPERMKKQFVPWSYDLLQSKFIAKAFPAPRPLYGLRTLAKHPTSAVIIAEGEKSADAAQQIVGNKYVVVTFSGGSSTWGKANWTAIHGKHVVIWPDADEAGKKAADGIAESLRAHCPSIKIINVKDMPDGWDAANALADGWDWDRFKTWALARIEVFKEAEKPRPAPPPFPRHAPPPQRADDYDSEPDEPITSTKTSRTPNIDRRISAIELGLNCKEDGRPHENLDNVVRVLETHPQLKGTIWYDTFYQRIFRERNGKTVPWSDVDDSELTLFLQRIMGMTKIGSTLTHEAAHYVGMQNQKNEVQEWMSSLQWDQTPRLASMMVDGFGCNPSEYLSRVGTCWMISIAARVFRPGCKVDTVPVFEGGQGSGKSSALRVLGGKWFTECHESVMNKDFYGVLCGNIIVEISEMHSFGRVEVERIKGIISNQIDRYRSPYGRNVEDHPRMSVFAGTTNRKDWNHDDTGARRFWPVATGRISTRWLSDNRDQLFAEAVAAFNRGDDWWIVPELQARAEQEARRQNDSWEEIITNWVKDNIYSGQFTTSEILDKALKIEPGKHDRVAQMRVGSIMRVMGYESIVSKINGASARVWKKDE